MDRSCRAQLLAEFASASIPIGHEHALIARGQVGSEKAGWLQSQPLWQKISREEPD